MIEPRLAEGQYDRLPALAADLVESTGEPDRDAGASGSIRREGGNHDNPYCIRRKLRSGQGLASSTASIARGAMSRA